MAIYIGSDKKQHKTNIIGLLPSKDFGRECAFNSHIDDIDFKKLFSAWNEWTNTKPTIYVQYNIDENNKPKALGMTVEFNDNKEYNIILSKDELKYLTTCLILYLHNKENKYDY